MISLASVTGLAVLLASALLVGTAEAANSGRNLQSWSYYSYYYSPSTYYSYDSASATVEGAVNAF